MTADRIADRMAEIRALSASQQRIKALSEEERVAWARGMAENDLARVKYLPGRLFAGSASSSWRKPLTCP